VAETYGTVGGQGAQVIPVVPVALVLPMALVVPGGKGGWGSVNKESWLEATGGFEATEGGGEDGGETGTMMWMSQFESSGSDWGEWLI